MRKQPKKFRPKPIIDPVAENPRGEVPACPTGLSDPLQADMPQQPGGGGAPMTGAVEVSVPPSHGEGGTEKDIEQSGLDDAKE